MTHIRNSRSAGPPQSSPRASKRAQATRGRSPRHAAVGRAAQVCASPLSRRTPRQDRARETVDAVVQAAEQILVESGYGNASTNAIAQRAGVSIGSLYQYFSNKEELFRAVVRKHRGQVLPTVVDALTRMSEPNSDLIELAIGLLRDMARVNAGNPRLMGAIEGELGWLEHEGDSEFELSSRVQEILRRRSSLDPRRIAVTAELMIMTLAPLSRWLVHSKPTSLDTDMFLDAVRGMLRGLLEDPLRPED
jgi:AcrR family transcriptional regulator